MVTRSRWSATTAVSTRETRKHAEAIRFERGIRKLAPRDWPAFIWLPEPSDRESARPIANPENLDDIIPGARITSVTVEITDEPLPNELFQKLPWLQDAWDLELSKGTTQNPSRFRLFAYNLMGYN